MDGVLKDLYREVFTFLVTTKARLRLSVPIGREYLIRASKRSFGFNANSIIRMTCAH